MHFAFRVCKAHCLYNKITGALDIPLPILWCFYLHIPSFKHRKAMTLRNILCLLCSSLGGANAVHQLPSSLGNEQEQVFLRIYSNIFDTVGYLGPGAGVGIRCWEAMASIVLPYAPGYEGVIHVCGNYADVTCCCIFSFQPYSHLASSSQTPPNFIPSNFAGRCNKSCPLLNTFHDDLSHLLCLLAFSATEISSSSAYPKMLHLSGRGNSSSPSKRMFHKIGPKTDPSGHPFVNILLICTFSRAVANQTQDPFSQLRKLIRESPESSHFNVVVVWLKCDNLVESGEANDTSGEGGGAMYQSERTKKGAAYCLEGRGAAPLEELAGRRGQKTPPRQHGYVCTCAGNSTVTHPPPPATCVGERCLLQLGSACPATPAQGGSLEKDSRAAEELALRSSRAGLDEVDPRLSHVVILLYDATGRRVLFSFGDGNTARLARRSDVALGVRVSVALIAPSFLDLGRAVWSGAGMNGLVKREIREKKCRLAESSGTISASEDPE
ncbi:hypothetical protein PR048_031353 [Dryococelus australis]|uniref:Uncharacterized protein n=1 Tax=Dryococelus australis TaxID=614101 RepID=A0ABQ9G7S1_9NEOP|nr:hypothetical protein PR048_031353 [Dryococelus australis]